MIIEPIQYFKQGSIATCCNDTGEPGQGGVCHQFAGMATPTGNPDVQHSKARYLFTNFWQQLQGTATTRIRIEYQQ